MSVLSCDVAGCPNIMCDRFSQKLQKYICNDCHARLVAKGLLDKLGIQEFFDTDVENDKPLSNSNDPNTYYDEIFPIK